LFEQVAKDLKDGNTLLDRDQRGLETNAGSFDQRIYSVEVSSGVEAISSE
jgi:hypothetical protein